MRDPVEVTVSYATVVDEMVEAWAFISDYQDRVTRPRVEISPVTGADESREWVERYGVSVSGRGQ